MVVLLLTSCQEDFQNDKIIDEGTFRMVVPASWNSFFLAGYDSQVGGITNGKDSLTYDYGWFSADFSDISSETHARLETTIDGREALVIIPHRKGKDIIGVFVQVDSINRFTMYGKSKNEPTVLKVFSSVQFND